MCRGLWYVKGIMHISCAVNSMRLARVPFTFVHLFEQWLFVSIKDDRRENLECRTLISMEGQIQGIDDNASKRLGLAPTSHRNTRDPILLCRLDGTDYSKQNHNPSVVPQGSLSCSSEPSSSKKTQSAAHLGVDLAMHPKINL